jgi:hypothetical protein
MLPKAAVAGLASIAAGALLRRSGSRAHAEETRSGMERQIHNYVLFIAAPVWIGAGLLDYFWHRRTRIETTSGPKESVMHLLMLTEGAPIALAPLLFEINSGVLLLLMGAFIAHESTAAWDISMTAPRRVIQPGEQHIHSVLEMMPFCVASLYLASHWERFRTMLRNPRREDFQLRLKRSRASTPEIAGLVSAITLFDFLPHVEELWRCWRAQQRGLTGSDTPECAPVLYGGSWREPLRKIRELSPR